MQQLMPALYPSQVILNSTRCAPYQIARPRDGPAIARHLRCVSRVTCIFPLKGKSPFKTRTEDASHLADTLRYPTCSLRTTRVTDWVSAILALTL
ncbi:hypothetical protein ROTO_19240 [Roseovarius tolerans]|uniref:Uncharacterized protein n=1 Tax=Roseovarius tolerans TaxID=74031 RepID=A0A0L6CUS4_9RHOB|nr:hypothetical protein ROTO_19240 [Roseovarius tolerans]